MQCRSVLTNTKGHGLEMNPASGEFENEWQTHLCVELLVGEAAAPPGISARGVWWLTRKLAANQL